MKQSHVTKLMKHNLLKRKYYIINGYRFIINIRVFRNLCSEYWRLIGKIILKKGHKNICCN